MASTSSSNGLLAALSNELAAAVERAGRSIVTVDARRRLPSSGIIWPGGVVVTADHVLEREDDISVMGADGQRVSAVIAGRDPGSDVAVLRPSGLRSEPAELAAADSVRVGHLVLAVGRPGQGGPMVSFGVVSALGGTWRTARGGMVETYLRADVALYPGFSGGALVNAQGQVVGLLSSHLARNQEVAIPAHTLDAIVQALLKQGRIRRPYLGLSSQPVMLPPALRQQLGLRQETGLMVVWVESGSPAERCGLLMGDVVVALGNRSIERIEDLQTALGSASVGQPISVSVVRAGARKEMSVAPGERA